MAQAEDCEAMTKFFAALSSESKRRRFFVDLHRLVIIRRATFRGFLCGRVGNEVGRQCLSLCQRNPRRRGITPRAAPTALPSGAFDATPGGVNARSAVRAAGEAVRTAPRQRRGGAYR